MAKQRVRFTFSSTLIPEPIIWELGHEFPIVTNIRRAQVEEEMGWVVLELTGDQAKIDEGLEWVRSKGVRVDPVVGDVVEG